MGERMDRPPMTHAENEDFLQRLRDRRARLGVEEQKIEVRFEDLRVQANMLVGTRALPTLLNATINTVQELMGSFHITRDRKKFVKILKGLKGIIRPSRMTLVLGPPGSGKSTFLRALAGKLDPSLKVKGKVSYNGEELSRFVPQRTCAYVSQDDLHHAEMTVRETLHFSERMLGGDRHISEMLKEEESEDNDSSDDFSSESTYSEEKGSNFVTDYVLKILRLKECADTLVGDDMRRGISGGQKKRVTIGEMLVGLARSFFMDDISTGLDSSTTFEIIKFLRQMTHLMDLTMVISLLQPPPETFELFDDIILLCEGRIVYQGPRESVLEFFESMGFRCPERKNTADFLQEVISKMDQAQYWTGDHSSYRYVKIKKFARSFHSFHVGLRLQEELKNPGNHKQGDAPIKTEGIGGISKGKLFKTCFSREVLLMKRNSPLHIFKIIQISLLAFIVMTVFIRTEMKHDTVIDGNHFIGALTTAVVIVKFNGMVEMTMMMRRLPVFYKQRELLFLPGWALLSSIFLLSLPTSLAETGLWTCLTYYAIGFAPPIVRFFKQFLALFCVHQMSSSLFRLIAVIGRTQVMANTLGTATLVAIYILGGFVISRDNIKRWLLWGYWASPLTYAQNSVAINEFLDNRWNKTIHIRNIEENTVGKAILKSRGMFTEEHWFWISVLALFGFSLLFNFLTVLALEFFNSPKTHQANTRVREKNIKQAHKIDIKPTGAISPQSGMVLPFQPLTIEFNNISYFVDMPTEMKRHGFYEKRLQLLKDVTGAFRPGVLTALMGVTGAGKTTLLDVLAGRKTGGYIEGNINICGHPKRQETFARISGYCEQSDVHSPCVTVEESLQYSAWLRLPSHINSQTRNMFVEEVMDLVELKLLKNAMVGLPGVSGLSAEQRKRLTIAVELVASPSIIFMDEPTTGLDARAAAIVMRTVRKTVDTGRTIVCTIHQPSIDIFEAFDELLLMKIGGQLIYGGPLGTFSQQMVQYFEAIPGVPNIKEGQNPAAWMLDVTSTSMEFKLQVDFAALYQNSSESSKNIELVKELSNTQSNKEDLHFPTKYAQSFKVQCIACLWKQHKSYWKNPEHNVIRFIITICTSLLFSAVFWKIASKITTEQDIFNILGVMYGASLFIGYTSGRILQPVVAMERTVFYRERSAGMYSSMPYALAQVAIETPYAMTQVLVFCVIVYPMIGFPFQLIKFFWFLVFMTLCFAYMILFCMNTVTLTPTLEMADLLSFFFFILWNLFCGFFVPRLLLPSYWRWFYWANPAAWTIYGQMVSQLGDEEKLIQIPGAPDESVKAFLEGYLGLESKYFPLIVTLHVTIILFFLFLFGFSIKHLKFQRR
ncbi:ABC transporter G family member 34 [Acorus calamus]|uniref:ABC transporter G family member 34 n=1 Tax=Acorus calamus TaxID=4465 RepID=A0AAV9DXV1_ACOCL|nr:ABC transporter G family member 34 [Acorus calamus]